MMRSLAARPTALLAAGLIVLAACGEDDADTTATDVEQPADDPAEGEDGAPTDDEADDAATDGDGTDEQSTDEDADEDADDAGGDDAEALTCADLAGAEQALLDAAGVGQWTGDTGGFDGLCSVDGADGFVSVFNAFESTPEEYFEANGFGEASADGDVVTATNEFGLPAAGAIVDGRVVLANIDGTVEPAAEADAAAVLRVALDALAG